MKKIFLILFLVQNVLVLYAQYDDPYQYYPMSVGNYWYFNSGPDYYTSEKVFADSVDDSGNRFFWMFDRSNHAGFPPSYKIDTNYFVYGHKHYKLNALPGERYWYVFDENGDTTIGHYFEVTSIYDGFCLGIETRFKVYTYYQRIIKGNRFDDIYYNHEVLAYGIGKVFRDNDSNPPDVLEGAIIDGKVIGNPVGIEENTAGYLPDNFELFQNYPNPFNPTTTISYSIPQNQQGSSSIDVKIVVYDPLGREVTTLVNDQKTAGTYSVTFNAQGLSSGVYCIQFVSENVKETIKALLIK